MCSSPVVTTPSEGYKYPSRTSLGLKPVASFELLTSPVVCIVHSIFSLDLPAPRFSSVGKVGREASCSSLYLNKTLEKKQNKKDGLNQINLGCLEASQEFKYDHLQ